jgi:hypothetical protein
VLPRLSPDFRRFPFAPRGSMQHKCVMAAEDLARAATTTGDGFFTVR